MFSIYQILVVAMIQFAYDAIYRQLQISKITLNLNTYENNFLSLSTLLCTTATIFWEASK